MDSVTQWATHTGAPSLLRYFVVIAAVWLFSAAVTTVLQRGTIQSIPIGWRQLGRELLFSIITAVMFSAALNLSIAFGFTNLHEHFGPVGTTLSVLALIVLHDAWFYWTHRTLHLRRFLPIHRLHHSSRRPTVLTSYSFHPAEAAVNGAFIIVAGAIVPVTIPSLVIFIIFMIARNALGHCGREVFPARRDGTPLFGWLTTVTHHDMHHELATKNYGLYFTYWDRWMGTEHPQYHAKFARNVKALQADLALSQDR